MAYKECSHCKWVVYGKTTVCPKCKTVVEEKP